MCVCVLLTRLEDFLRSSETRWGEEGEGNPPPERDRWWPGTLRELCLARGWVGERGTAFPGLWKGERVTVRAERDRV